MKSFALRIMLAAAIGLGALPVLGQQSPVRVLGEHTAWTAYATAESTGQICFVISRPTSSEPAGYSDAYFYITHRPAQSVRSEINLVAGYGFAPGSAATLTVGGQSFALVTEDDAAWLADAAQTTAAVQAIRGGSTMTVQGTSTAGQTIRQSFSLSGATAATNAIDGAC